MSQFLFYYQRPEPATWVFMSSFVIVALYFMFHRLWSIRNLDVALLILLTPGLMLVYEGRKANAVAARESSNLAANATTAGGDKPLLDQADRKLEADLPGATPASPEGKKSVWTGDRLQYYGFLWLLSVCGLWVVRLLLDTTMVRRPLLEPNLTNGGTTFIGISLFVFLMANVVTSPSIVNSKAGIKPGPGYDLLNLLPDIQTSPDPTAVVQSSDLAQRSKPIPGGATREGRAVGLARLFLIVSNLVLVLGIVAIGYWHFENLKTGIGVATLFLLLPYTAQMTGRVDHLAPGALMVLAVAFYRKPLLSGLILGGAAGLVFYPFFLLPLWISFYWLRGRRRFIVGFLASIVSMVGTLVATSQDGYIPRLMHMFGTIPFAFNDLDGVWGLGWNPYFRIPVMVAFVLLSLSFVFWPAQKSLATLMSCSAAIMTAAQFCYAYGGGLYMAWFLPCALLTVFRPNLDDCIALDVVRPFIKRKTLTDPSNPNESSSYAEAG
jgi:hypothetical protein